MTHPAVLAAEATTHRTQLLSAAADARTAKLARPAPGPIRTRTGHLLVRLGHKLADL
jgi:hypothetical protein